MHYPNLEELETIEQSPTGENAIREEHLIETRMGHDGAAQLRAAPAPSPQPAARSGPPVLQAVRVYQQPTRSPGDGFSEEAMYGHFSKNAEALALEDHMGDLDFRYAGQTGSASKANTDFSTKLIRVNKALAADVAALSFAYELTNASQNDQFQEILQMPVSDFGTHKIAREFAEHILRGEARSVLMRSRVALSMGKGDLVVNQAYIQIAADGELSQAQKLEKIFQDMKLNGKVHGGAKRAYDHYVEMFWKDNQKSMYGLD